MIRIVWLGIILMTVNVRLAFAESDLLYLEGQGIVGYSSAAHKVIYRSAQKHDVMQKNAVGFDYLHKFSNTEGDWGMLALQARLAYTDDKEKAVLSPQLYNAYFKYKNLGQSVWVGHNRVAFGLASYWDTHADLIGDLTMYGVSYDRDWGMGYSYEGLNGRIETTLTSGTGMNFRAYGNWLSSTRVSYGVLNYDNYTIGLSFQFGRVLDTMGYDIESHQKREIYLAGWDAAYHVDQLKHKIELDGGTQNHKPYYAALYRLSVGLDEEERFLYELQPVYVLKEGEENWSLSQGLSYLLTPDITMRFMYQYQKRNHNHLYVGQIYWYFPV